MDTNVQYNTIQPSPALPTQVSGLSADFSLSTLMPCSEEEVRRLIKSLPSPVRSTPFQHFC